MDSDGPDYPAAFRRMMQENVNQIIPALDKKEVWLMTKIAKAAARYGVSEDDIIAALRECEVLRFYLAKDPMKQSMHENTAAEFIRAIPGVEDFKQPRRRVDQRQVVGGALVSPDTVDNLRVSDGMQNYTKTIDFTWKFRGRTYFAYHKHTDVEGGAQGNQRNDVKTFLQQAAKNPTPDISFIALCDGNFYQYPNGRLGRTKMDSLRAIADEATHSNVFVMSCAELPSFLANHG